MRIVPIEAAQDPRVADYADVREAEFVKRRGIFLAEGTEVVRTAIERGRFPIRSVFLMDNRVDALRSHLERLDDAVPVFVAPGAVMSAVVGFDIHRGCLAAGERNPAGETDPLDACPTPGSATVLFLEALANHDNVGSVFRSAAAFGVRAILLDPRSADPLYRKAIRTSMAATLTLPFGRVGGAAEALARLRSSGFETIALTPSGDERLADVAVRHAPRRALLLGTEGRGLSDEAIAGADRRVRIPMVAGHDSLNVAVAAAVALYQLTADVSAASVVNGREPR